MLEQRMNRKLTLDYKYVQLCSNYGDTFEYPDFFGLCFVRNLKAF